MNYKEERTKLRKQLADLKYQETLKRHLADRQPEEYEKLTKQIKVIRRKIASVAYEEQEEKKKGR